MKIVSTESLSLKSGGAGSGGKYAEIITACTSLKEGQSILLDAPADEKKGPKGYRNKLSYKIRNVKTPVGTFLRVRVTTDGKQIAVSLVKGTRPARPKNLDRTPAQIAEAKAKREAAKKKKLAGAAK